MVGWQHVVDMSGILLIYVNPTVQTEVQFQDDLGLPALI